MNGTTTYLPCVSSTKRPIGDKPSTVGIHILSSIDLHLSEFVQFFLVLNMKLNHIKVELYEITGSFTLDIIEQKI